MKDLSTFALKWSVPTKSACFDIIMVLLATTDLYHSRLIKSYEKFGIGDVYTVSLAFSLVTHLVFITSKTATTSSSSISSATKSA